MLLAFVILLLSFFITPANAEDKHAKHHHLYQSLKIPNTKRSCCNEHDCRPTEARFNSTSKSWEAKLNDAWVTIPPDKILPDNEVPDELKSEAHICAPPNSLVPGGYNKSHIFCFVRPNGGT